jgi:hypothetical protein
MSEASTAEDVNVTNHGSLLLFALLTNAAKDWVEENVAEPQWFGYHLVCEHRYAADLVAGMRADGLEVR